MDALSNKHRTHLIVQCIKHIPAVERDDKNHRVGQLAKGGQLSACQRDIEYPPEDKTWSEFVESLDIE